MQDDDYQLLIARCLSFIAIRPRSEQELRTYISKRIQKTRIDESVGTRVMERLAELGYVDDVAFARAYIESSNTFRPKGKRVLAMALRQKGVPDTAITLAFAALSADQGVNERELAIQAARKRLRSLTGYERKERRNKLYAFLARRGFDQGIIGGVIDELDPKGLQ